MIPFSSWMNEYPDHKYSDATIKRYVRALNKAEEWFDISLPKKILDVTNHDEFQIIQKRLKGVPNFEKLTVSMDTGIFLLHCDCMRCSSPICRIQKRTILNGGLH